MMKKLLFACSLALAIAAPRAFALPTVSFMDGPGNTGGGEFYAQTSANGNFLTFCLEYTEHIAFGGTYYYGVSQEAKYNGSFPNTDPLSRPAAWLYLQFRLGTLIGYTHTDVMADELQRAIWFLENETGGVNNDLAQRAITEAGPANVNNNGYYGVGVMNLWANEDGTGARQDQLILVPDGGSTVALLGFALCALGIFHRRERRISSKSSS